MDNKLFTAIEVIVIGGLIFFVLYLGGIFKTAADPTPTVNPYVTVEPTLDAKAPTRTPRPTRTPAPLTPTPTTPALTEPAGLIAFNSTRTGDIEVFVVNADGSNLRNLTNNSADDYVLSWSPDGQRLAFLSTRSGWLELYVVDVATGAILRLTDTQASNTAYNYPISWSPDGEYIFASRANPWVTGNFTRTVQLDRIRTDGSGVQNISSFDKQYQFWNMLMSPDGQYVAYTAQSVEGYGVHSAQMSAEGLMAPQLVSMICYSFTWMPNSHRLLCANGGTLYMMELTGGEKETVGGDPQGYASSFGASPDGQWVLALYQFYSDQSDLTKQTFVAISTKDESMVKVVSDAAIDAETSAGYSWANDSQWFAYTSHQFGPRDIFITNIFDPNDSRQIAATTLGENFNPRWQP